MKLQPLTAFSGLALLALAALMLSLFIGSVSSAPHEIWRALMHGDSTLTAIVFDLRLPRALSAFAAGALLAAAGAILQALLRNPLADPYVLGISGGAAVAALLALAAQAALIVVQGAAALGALAALALLFVLARRALFAHDVMAAEQATTAVLLIGVMIASFTAAALSFLLAVAPQERLRSMMFWLLGDLSGATDLRAALAALAVLALVLLLAAPQAARLNLMLHGDVAAFTQGVDVEKTRRHLIVVAALATGAAVTLGGALGFVGFVAPHFMRLLLGNDQRVLLPAAALAGGVLVALADVVARSAIAPQQLPVGVITALVGVPLFLFVLRR